MCLLLAAASGDSDLQLLSRAARALDVEIGALAAAQDAGLIKIAAGRIEFRHPLVRSAVYSDATLGARRAAHRALASVLPDQDLDRRAWHLAAAAVGADETASRHSSGRPMTASSAAATRPRPTRSSTPPALRTTGTRCTALLVQAAEAAWDAGRAEHASRLLAESGAIGMLEPHTRVAAEWLAGRIATNRGPVMAGHGSCSAQRSSRSRSSAPSRTR